MDQRIQSFLELTASNDLVQLVADKRAAWLWSADGARILWSNAAGAAFFSAGTVAELTGLSALERSPARPHIARIAESGLTDRFSIDRLRFYRGLRVMLLTCQCKKVDLEDGGSAALIICTDKGLATKKDPVAAFAHLLKSEGTTVFVLSNGVVEDRSGTLEGAPEDLDLPQDQRVLSGPLDLKGAYHDGILLKVPAGPKLVVLNNTPLPADNASNDDGKAENAPALEELIASPPASVSRAADEADRLQDETPQPVDDASRETSGPDNAENGPEGVSEWVRADELYFEPDELHDETVSVPSSPKAADAETPAQEKAEDALPDETKAEEAPGEIEAFSPHAAQAPVDVAPEAPTEFERNEEETDPVEEETSPPLDAEESFVFHPRRRPVRFAWKMDIDQRFTFLSDEFADVLGPDAANVAGLTWEEVCGRFGLDPRGHIARALDRRDTWSGKTVDWPVSGAALRVPVDMAALPAFDRNRVFEGYRGFGVCRTADAFRDPNGYVAGPAAPLDDDTGNGTDAEPPNETLREEPDTEPAVQDTATDPDRSLSSPDEILTDDHTDTSEEADFETHAIEAPEEDLLDEAATAPEEALPQQRLEDLKPAQPDTFAGKTFLGASAAALVGSLAKITGKSAPAAPEAPEETPEIAEATETVSPGEDLTADLRAAAAALDEEPDETAASDEATEEGIEETAGQMQEDGTDGQPAEETAPEDEAPTEEDGFAAETSDSLTDDALEDDQAGDTPSGETLKSEKAPQEETAQSGIAGPAPLRPSEIESAVKSLAKSYKSAEKATPDLFEDEPPANDDLLPHEEDVSPADERDEQETPDGVTEDAGAREEDADLDEREFFEETAAYHRQDRASEAEAEAEADETDSAGAPPPRVEKTGEVIPLATARPRVVPVDTSGLSRPEREAFRKIAEALGARLEGDLDDFEEAESTEESAGELPPEVPETGPIDPSLLDRLPIGIAVVHDREVLYANKALLRMLGYMTITALSEAGGLEALFIDDTEDLPDAAGMDGEVDETMKMRKAGGGVICVDAHMHSVPWNGSRGLMISVTERPAKPAQDEAAASAAPNFFAEVRAELDAARNQIAEMDTILETATDGVLVLDVHGTILKVNGSAEALFSANRADMIGAPFTDYLAPESQRAATDYLDGLSRNGVASILNDGREVLGKVPSGGLIPLFMTIGRVASSENDAKYCAVLRDITQWKTAEEELTQAKRHAENASSQKSDFLAKISHEIRTPLNAIIGFSEVMMEERFGPIGNDRYKDYLKDIRTSGSHIMSLINDLLDLSKIEAGKLDLNFSAVSTNDVINECVALMQPQANRERVIIRASLPESVPDVVADPRSLRQIVLNLLSNAIKYNKSGGQVILSTALESNGEVALRVRDTGTGMTPKQLAAALEPFRQVHTSSRGGGTGLGLPLTKALVEANRASFHIDSTPDQGTLVEIVFPTQRVLSE
ncbi:ATP-binding protein [Roseibium aggregatum]|uniref:histidine kinase n=1 Tax=Roseibium aggregatum TaxID=187304 RepID=A0A939J1Z1_9HYPH|nr:ATP-binding protein [Roseibium aggregatum]MBN9668982.1 PAS domain S-box protein [Roseibium aggregatum]